MLIHGTVVSAGAVVENVGLTFPLEGVENRLIRSRIAMLAVGCWESSHEWYDE